MVDVGFQVAIPFQLGSERGAQAPGGGKAVVDLGALVDAGLEVWLAETDDVGAGEVNFAEDEESFAVGRGGDDGAVDGGTAVGVERGDGWGR